MKHTLHKSNNKEELLEQDKEGEGEDMQDTTKKKKKTKKEQNEKEDDDNDDEEPQQTLLKLLQKEITDQTDIGTALTNTLQNSNVTLSFSRKNTLNLECTSRTRTRSSDSRSKARNLQVEIFL